MTQLTPQTLLVTGGAGFIASSFVGQAVERGQRVIVLDKLTYAGHRANLDWIDAKGWSGSYELVVGDICDGDLVATLLAKHQPDALVHFAAESHVDNSIESPAEFVETNVVGSYRLLEASRAYWNGLEGERKADYRHLQVSTDEVFGELGNEGYFSEKTPYQPNSPYSASKAAADHFARAWFHTYGLPTITTNCSNNYGPRHFPEKLIPLMITSALSGKPLPVYGEGLNVRDWIHVQDHTRGVYLALTKGQAGETYCFGGRSERKNIDVVKAICELLAEMGPQEHRDYTSQITHVKDRAGHDWRYAIDDSKAERELGFEREFKDFEAGLRATIEWFLANQDWCARVLNEAKEVA
jgi:dTDP-glucose 4,6-dehydratase